MGTFIESIYSQENLRIHYASMNDPLAIIAAKKVKKKKNFYLHFSLWLMITFGLVVFNIAVTPGFYWSLIISFTWSVFLLIHAFRVSEVFSMYQKWDRYQFEKELAKLDISDVKYLPEYTAHKEMGDWNGREFV